MLAMWCLGLVLVLKVDVLVLGVCVLVLRVSVLFLVLRLAATTLLISDLSVKSWCI